MSYKKAIKTGIEAFNSPKKQKLHVFNVEDLSVIRTKDLIDDFPMTRYYGSKKRLLHWIYECIKDLPFKTVIDGFGGTASVSLLMKSMGKSVTFNDALLSNAVSARALLANKVPFKCDQDVDNFYDSIVPVEGFIYDKFKGKFYLDEENSWLDGAVQAIEKEHASKKDALYYCLFQACLQKRPFNLFHRANLNIRINREVKRSFGNQTTWDTPFPVLAKRAYRELKKAVWMSSLHQEVLSPIDVSTIKTGFDLVYLDPPYINVNNSGDDYQRRYHFLDGMCQYKQWGKMIDYSYKNLQLKKQLHITEWQNKTCFKKKLFDLIEKHSKSIVVLSYVEGAYPSVEVLESFFNKTFDSHKVHYHKLPHALSKGKKNEVLIVGMPK